MSWTWRELTDPALNGVLKPVMKALENELEQIQKVFKAHAVIRTTDATATVLYTATIPVDHTVVVTGWVAGRRTGGSSGSANDGAGYRVEFAARNSAGTAALIGAPAAVVLGEDQAAWAVTLVAASGTIQVKVAGAANNNVTWNCTFRKLSVKE